jgi:hypothetical protein
MAADASELLGSAQLAGVYVLPRGRTMARAWSQGGRVAGGVGAAGAELAGGKAAKQGAAERADTPLTGKALLAVTEAEVAIVTLKSGGLTTGVGEVVSRVIRSRGPRCQMGWCRSCRSPSLTGQPGRWTCRGS